jgi:hypothetical protein
MSGKIRLNGSTSGFSEITAPAVAGDQTFTLPAAGGEIAVVGSSIPWNRIGTNLSPTDIGDSVGIGTTNPTTKLDVRGGTIRCDSDSDNYQIFANNGFTRGVVQVAPDGVGLDIKSTFNNSGYISVSTISEGALYERLRIKANGETEFTGPGLNVKQNAATPYPTKIRSAATVFTNLGTSAQAMTQSTSVSSGLYICTIVNKDGDKGSFMFLTGVESGVAHKYRLIGDGGSCSVSTSGSENNVFSISSLGDGRTYTLTFSLTSQQNPPTLKANSTATGTTEIVIAAIGSY